MRRRSGHLVENERRILLALDELGEAWSRPLLDKADEMRDDGLRTGGGTLLRAMATFESKDIVVADDRYEPKLRRYYKLTDRGRRLVEQVKAQAEARAEFELARARYEQATAAIDVPS